MRAFPDALPIDDALPGLAEALRANRIFLERLCQGLEGGVTPAAVLQAKRQTQRANSLVFSSLNRMAGDPEVKQDGIERFAALANHNLRITRALSVGAVHVAPGTPPFPGLEPMAQAAGAALEALAAVVKELRREGQALQASLALERR